ncbi:hypothetical protein JCM21900_004785 [Sporobolomyces salmonicolor]
MPPLVSVCTAKPLSASLSPAHSHRPPLSSPTKRGYRTSPTSSPTLGGSEELDQSPRVLRTKLSNVADEVRLEFKLDIRAPAVEAGQEDAHTPNTPPEERPEPLIGLGVGVFGYREKQVALGDFQAAEDEGATQTATAERQMRELASMPVDMQYALARLCSQHPGSEYNSLKKAVAAAAAGPPQQAPVQTGSASPSQQTPPPMPTFPHIQRSSNSGPSSPPAAHSRSLARPASTGAIPVRTRQTAAGPPRTPALRAAGGALPKSTLTPTLARLNFELSPVASTSASVEPPIVAIQSAKTLLSDLVAGEPVAVQRTPTKVVVSEKVPAAHGSASRSPPPQFSELPGPPSTSIPGLLPGMTVVNGVPVKTSVSHPINISPLVPPELLPYFASRIFASTSSSAPRSPLAPASSHLLNSISPSPSLLRPHPECDLLTLTTPTTSGCFPSPPSLKSLPLKGGAPRALGNFLLSSCPGKKVRMNGEPIKGGRGAICRDVKLDLQRAKDEGVRMVVCCLDDQELAYLGTPYQEYAAACSSLGISILRIPMVEGFAPSSPSSLDVQLECLIQNHTLRGESVLAHCRGGIGRAGLVASCWMIKMGFVGAAGTGMVGEREESEVDWMKEEPMRILERVIELIRRRRSVKSIETTHQVLFLLQYIIYLQQNAHLADASALVATPLTI